MRWMHTISGQDDRRFTRPKAGDADRPCALSEKINRYWNLTQALISARKMINLPTEGLSRLVPLWGGRPNPGELSKPNRSSCGVNWEYYEFKTLFSRRIRHNWVQLVGAQSKSPRERYANRQTKSLGARMWHRLFRVPRRHNYPS